MKIDFMCVGYAKCGTTTLDAILRQYKNINLPIVKEPHFFEWKDKYENPLEKLYSEYFEGIEDNQCVGIVDPTLVKTSIEEMDRYFGNDTKVIIMLRNPVKTLYSEFRMGLRLGYYWGYYSPLKRDTVAEKFERFFCHCEQKKYDWKKPALFCYDEYLEELYASRKKEDIKVIVFEEFIKNPAKYKEELEEFLEIESEEAVDFNVWKNEGKVVNRNYFCARWNNWILEHFVKSPSLKKKAIGRELRKLDKFTMVPNDEKISPQTEKRCMDYYRDSKNKVAELIGKDLDQLWFK